MRNSLKESGQAMLTNSIFRRQRLFLTLLVFLASLIIAGGKANAQPTPDSLQVTTEFELISQAGGAIRSMSADGDMLYIASGSSISVVDASSPNNPTLLGQSTPLTATIRQIVYANGLLFAAADFAGLAVIDVRNPASPQIVNRVASGRATALIASGALLYVVDATSGLRVFDLTTPNAPLQIALVSTLRQTAYSIVQLGTRLLIARGYEGIEIVDISQPSQPVVLGRHTFAAPITSLLVAGEALYAGSSGTDWKVLRIGAGAQISEVATITGNVRAAVVAGSVLYAAEWLGLATYDISDPFAPRQTGWFDSFTRFSDTSADSAQMLLVAGARLFTLNALQQVRVFDISQPQIPAPVGVLDRPIGDAQSVQAVAGRLFVLENSRLRVQSLAAPDALSLVGSYSFSSSVTALEVRNNLAYVAGFGGVSILDVANPQPRLVGATKLTWLASGLVLSGDIAVVPNYQGCALIEVRVPSAPSQVGMFPCAASNRALAAFGATVYTRDANANLQIVDISNPASPSVVRTLDMTDDVRDVAVDGSLLMVAAGASMNLFDLATPSAPVEIGVFDSGGSWIDAILAVAGGVAYLSQIDGALVAVDVSKPDLPIALGKQTLTDNLRALAVSGRYAYALTDDGSLSTLWFGRRITTNVQSGATISFSPPPAVTYQFAPDTFMQPGDGSEGIELAHVEPFAGSWPLPSSLRALSTPAQLAVRTNAAGDPLAPLKPYTVTVRLDQLAAPVADLSSLSFQRWRGDAWQPISTTLEITTQTASALLDDLAPWVLTSASAFRTFLPLVVRSVPDVRILSVEVTQAIQTTANDVALVAGRSTLLRVFASTSNPQPESNVQLAVVASRNGQSLAGSPLLAGPWAVFPAPERGNYGHSFNVLLPPAWLTGDVALALTLSSAGPDADPTNNSLTSNLSFQLVPPLDLKLAPIEYVDTATNITYPALTSEAVSDFLLRSYPVNRVNVSLRSPLRFSGNLRQFGDVMRLLTMIETAKKSDGAPDSQVYYGLLPDGNYGAAVAGIAWVNQRVSLGFNRGSLAAHEIGHNLGRRHAPCGNPAGVDPNYPYANASIGQVGFDVGTLRLQQSEQTADIMSYCNPAWFSDYTYRGLLADQLQHGSLFGAPAAQGLLVRASLDDAGGATLAPIYTLPGIVSGVDQSSNYTVALLAQDGRVLAEHPVGVAQAEEDGLQAQAISSLIPQPAEPVAIVQVRRAGAVVAERRLMSDLLAASTAQVEQAGDLLTLRWPGSDTPVLVRYTHNGGARWTTLAVDLLGGELQIDATRLPGGVGQFELIPADRADAGVHSAALLAGMTLPDKPPRTWISGPTEAAVGQPLVLFGHGDDLEDSVITELRWTVDGQAVEAQQALQLTDLTPGEHLVRLEVVDSSGQVAVAEHSVRVGRVENRE